MPLKSNELTEIKQQQHTRMLDRYGCIWDGMVFVGFSSHQFGLVVFGYVWFGIKQTAPVKKTRKEERINQKKKKNRKKIIQILYLQNLIKIDKKFFSLATNTYANRKKSRY